MDFNRYFNKQNGGLNIPNEREKVSEVAKGTIWVFLPHTKIDTSVPAFPFIPLAYFFPLPI
jgi:hypothetical protein